MKLKKIGVLSMGVNTAVYAGLLGVLIGVMFALFSLMGAGASNMEGAGMLASFGLLSVIIFPIVYGIFGFIGGVIGALFLNIAYKITGGQELEME
jgi:hypothetical protein